MTLIPLNEGPLTRANSRVLPDPEPHPHPPERVLHNVTLGLPGDPSPGRGLREGEALEVPGSKGAGVGGREDPEGVLHVGEGEDGELTHG